MDRAHRLRNRSVALLLAASVLAAASSASQGDLIVWRLEGGSVVADVGAPTNPLPVGSLQKPFVAKAWARAHPAAVPEPFRCDARSGCWLRSGHGLVDMTRATALSCNAYFRHLAEGTPEGVLVATLRGEGFVVGEHVSPEAAIGLGSGSATIPPATLLDAYRRLTREPWTTGESVRRLLLSGLRDAALSGTASGLAGRGYWAKTGTSAAIDGRPAATSGWAVAVDDSGWGVLGLLPEGTGREAALRLAAPLATLRPWTTPIGPVVSDGREERSRALAGPRVADRVRVSLFEALAPSRVSVRNCGGSPASGARGYVGAGATLDLRAGDRLGEALWELSIPERRMVRRLRGALSCESAPGDTLRVIADLEPREYVDGVLAAELPGGRPALRGDLAAAVLRFLGAGPRHEDADVCDTTHCAWFLGRGPRLTWRGAAATVAPRGDAAEAPLLDDDAWSRAEAASREPGPAFWTGHCGGAPLSPHAVWGNGDRRVASCPRHVAASRPWSRVWSEAEVAAAFGGAVDDLSVEWPDGVWTLEVRDRRLVAPLAIRRGPSRPGRVPRLGSAAEPGDARRPGERRLEGGGVRPGPPRRPLPGRGGTSSRDALTSTR